MPGSIIEKIPNKTRPNGKPVLENACYFIDNHGKILDRYVKKNLWYQERRHILGGGDNQEVPHRVIDTPLGKVGLLVCWDLAVSTLLAIESVGYITG